MAKKAILFARVSSDKQSFERQKSDLIPLIKSDKYTDDEIAIIQHKESAIKNDVQSRKSISELKELIANNPIESVYVSEISRLSRRNDVLYDVLALLEVKGISLIVQNPMIIRTYENGQPNPIAHVLIAFMSHLAVSEGIVKAERQASGLKQKISEGKITHRKVKFGYSKDKNGHAIINPEQAKVVVDIFNMYLDNNSVSAIWAKYNHTGIFPSLKDTSGACHINKILSDKVYIGEHKQYQYPALLDRELFDKVQDKLHANKLVVSKTKYVYYCSGLIKWNNRTLTPSAAKATYTVMIDKKYYSININCIDELCRILACEALSSMSGTIDQKRRESASESLKMAKLKVLGIEDDIASNEKEQDRVNMMFQKGKYTQEKWEYEIERCEGELSHLLKEKEQLGITITQLEAVLAKGEMHSMEQSRTYNSLMDVEDDIERQKMVKEAIESINLERVDDGWDIRIDYKDKSLNEDVYYAYRQRGCKIHLYCCYEDMMEDWSGTWPQRVLTLNKRKKESN